MAIGLRYIFSPQIMLYHLQVINRSLGDLDSRLQIMLLGFLKLGGAGMLVVGDIDHGKRERSIPMTAPGFHFGAMSPLDGVIR